MHKKCFVTCVVTCKHLMSHMPAAKLGINLLNPDPFKTSMVGKVMLWALSIGRYIVVFTELIVILSFVSRFKLDRDLTDLNTEIVRQKAIVESYGDLESVVRDLQDQLAFISQELEAPQPEMYLDLVVPLMPIDVKLNNMQMSGDTVRIEATALSQTGFKQFIRGLERTPQVKGIELSQVASENASSTINFELTISVVPQAQAQGIE